MITTGRPKNVERMIERWEPWFIEGDAVAAKILLDYGSLDSFRSNEILREIWRCVVPFSAEVNSIVRNRIIRVARPTFRPETLRSASTPFLASLSFPSRLAFSREISQAGTWLDADPGGKKGNLQALPFEVAFLRGQLVDFSWLSRLIDWGSSFTTDIFMEY